MNPLPNKTSTIHSKLYVATDVFVSSKVCEVAPSKNQGKMSYDPVYFPLYKLYSLEVAGGILTSEVGGVLNRGSTIRFGHNISPYQLCSEKAYY